MFKNDIIMKMVEAVALAVHRANALRESGDVDAAGAELDEATELLAGSKFWALGMMSLADIGKMLTGDRGTIEPTRAALVAELIVEGATSAAFAGQTGRAVVLDGRALEILAMAIQGAEDVDPDAGGTAAVHWDIMLHVARRVAERTGADVALAAVVEFAFECGEFGAAEDALFQLAKRGWDGAREAGERLYERLLALEDGALETGGLPRDEVTEGLADFRELMS